MKDFRRWKRGPCELLSCEAAEDLHKLSLFVDENRVIFLHGRDRRKEMGEGDNQTMLLPNCWLHDQNPIGSTQGNTRLAYATGSTGLAKTVRGSSRRNMIMRLRPVNIRLINRRQNLPRLLLALYSGKMVTKKTPPIQRS
jgi:hypothetical protein